MLRKLLLLCFALSLSGWGRDPAPSTYVLNMNACEGRAEKFAQRFRDFWNFWKPGWIHYWNERNPPVAAARDYMPPLQNLIGDYGQGKFIEVMIYELEGNSYRFALSFKGVLDHFERVGEGPGDIEISFRAFKAASPVQARQIAASALRIYEESGLIVYRLSLPEGQRRGSILRVRELEPSELPSS